MAKGQDTGDEGKVVGTATVRGKNRICIPIKVMEKINAEIGDEIGFIIDEYGNIIMGKAKITIKKRKSPSSQ